jgi:hypothetical protein
VVVLFSTIGGGLSLPVYTLVPNEAYNGGEVCIPMAATKYKMILITVLSTLYFFIPVIILIILNVFLLQGLFKSRESIGKEKHGTTKTDAKIMINLFFVSLVYIISGLPVATVALISCIGEATNWPHTSATTIQLIQELFVFTSTFHYTNYSSNYIVYVFSLDFYRVECRKIFCCGR